MAFLSRAHAQINLDALTHNLNQVRRLTPNAKVMAVVKSNAYGHGVEQVVGALHNADEFAVTDLRGVERLRNLGVSAPINTLSGQFRADDLIHTDSNTWITLFENNQIDALEQGSGSYNVWLKVDTGMGRLGFLPDQVDGVMSCLAKLANVKQIGLMSHLANADALANEHNVRQFEVLEIIKRKYDFTRISILNSGGVCGYSDQAHDVVRPGIMLYGASPIQNTIAADYGLQPVMTLQAPLLSVRSMPACSTIGYGSTYTLPEATRIGIVACGYGDGYPRHASTGTPVLVNGEIVPLVGRVSMDMIAVDLANVPAQVGDTAVLWGPGNPIEHVAHHANTIAYELTCRLTTRVTREYING